MKKQTDLFLLAIVVGALTLVVLAFAVVLLQPPASYRPDDTPEGVAINYLLAVQREDYTRAYGYLSSTLPGYPRSEEVFVAQVRSSSSREWASSGWTVQSSRTSGESVFVSIRETHVSGGGLFRSGESSWAFDMRLRREDGAWKVADSNSLWNYCWGSGKGCD